MKNSLFKIYGTVIVILTLMCSCQKDEGILDQEDVLTIEEARNWFETNNNSILLLDNSGTVNNKSTVNMQKPKKKIILQNDWEHAFTSKKGNIEVVEVALKSDGIIGHASVNSFNKWNSTKNHGYLISLSRLVIVKDRKENTIKSYIMTMIGETSYLENKNFQLYSNTYLKKDKDFSGMVFFQTVKGDFVNGWEFKKGKVTGKVTKNTTQEASNKSKTAKSSSNCRTYLGVTTYQQCTDWYSVGENQDEYFQYYSGTTCNTWSAVTNSFTICATDGGSNGGGGAGGSSQGGPAPYVFVTGDVLCKTGLATTMPVQIPNTCVTAIMEYIDNKFCGGSKNQAVFITDYAQTFGGNVIANGVNYAHMVNFSNRHFNLEAFQGIQGGIDNGNIMMTNVPSSIANSTHNVAIVGYRPGGDIIYMDPQEGKLMQAPQSHFSMNYVVSISSCK